MSFFVRVSFFFHRKATIQIFIGKIKKSWRETVKEIYLAINSWLTISEWETLSYLHLPAEGEASPQAGRTLTPPPGFFPWSTWITSPALFASPDAPAPLEAMHPHPLRRRPRFRRLQRALGSNVWPRLLWGQLLDLKHPPSPVCRDPQEDSEKGAIEKL